MVPFIHLKCQSAYSLLESTIRIGALVEAAVSFSMPAVALCDRGNMFGALEFSTKAKAMGVQPIHGCILKFQGMRVQNQLSEITLIAKDATGYQNLLYLVSLACTSNAGFLTLEKISERKEGLIILSRYLQGPIGQILLSKNPTLARSYAANLLDIFEGNFYFEITRHGLLEEKSIEPEYIQIAAQLKIPLVATNDVLFLEKEGWDVHDTFLCIANGIHKDTLERPRASSEAYLKSPKSMIELFKDIPSALENSVLIAKRCSFAASAHEPMMPTFLNSGSESDLLIKKSTAGLEERLKNKFETEGTKDQNLIRSKYTERLQYELKVLCEMNFAGYFLIVSDFIHWSISQGIPVGPGRGSVVGSIIAWSLKITDLDPIEFGLIFERFLNPERIQMPDIDIDFCQERRNEVINYVRQKYGQERVAHIITFGSLQAKAAIKDVARVLGLRFEIANSITNLIPFNAVSPVTLAQAIEQVPQLAKLFKGELIQGIESGENDDEEELKDLIKRTLSTALSLEGLPRHVSVHAAGIIISRDELVKILPLYKCSNDEALLVQYPLKYAELAGLVKFDFLGLQTLTLIAHCCSILKERGINVDFKTVPLNDTLSYQLLRSGRVKGIFQFESAGMRDSLQKICPDRIDDLMALTALYRPGPMENIPTYVACKLGQRQAQYLHPLLEPILAPTYGVILYQEQVMEVARVLAGYSLAQADLLRRAMGKKIASEMQEQKEIFVEGAVERGIREELAQEIFELLAKFAGYGFNKAHAAAYSIISFRTAYLKAHYTGEFFMAFLNLEFHDAHKLNALVTESKEFGIDLVHPSINSSSAYFVACDNKLNFGLGAIRNVSLSAAEEIAQERKLNGPFKNLQDFFERIGGRHLNKKVLEGLIQAGCFDCLNHDRAELFYNSERLAAYALRVESERNSEQISLLREKSSMIALKECKVWSKRETLYREFDSTGVFLNGHPLDLFKNFFEERGILSSSSLKELPDGTYQVKIAGIVQKKDPRTSARGVFILLVFSDHSGNFEASVFNEKVLREKNELLSVKSEVILDCEVLRLGGSTRIAINDVLTLESYMRQFPYEIDLQLENDEDFNDCISLLRKQRRAAKGNLRISLLLSVEGSLSAKIKLPELFDVDFCAIEYLSRFAAV